MASLSASRIGEWSSSSTDQPWGAFAGADEDRRRLLARHRRLSITPDDAAASLTTPVELDQPREGRQLPKKARPG
jgi:hypothetical protein